MLPRRLVTSHASRSLVSCPQGVRASPSMTGPGHHAVLEGLGGGEGSGGGDGRRLQDAWSQVPACNDVQAATCVPGNVVRVRS